MVHHFQVGAGAVGLVFALAVACTPEAGPVAEGEGSSSSETDTSTSTSAQGTDSGETDETGETETETETETDETGETETETGEPVCHDESAYRFPEAIDCMLEPLCPSVGYAYQAFECVTPDDYDAVAAACVIDALRAGTPALHQMRDCSVGKDNIETQLQVFDDGTVLWYHLRESCGSPSSYRETWRTLPDPAYFDACDITTGAGFGQCIEGILDQACVLGEPSCP
jgi:hypothetical protein